MLLQRAIAQRDLRFAARALRRINTLRKRLSPDALVQATKTVLPEGAARESVLVLVQHLASSESAQDAAANTNADASPDATTLLKADAEGIAETAMFLRFLISLYFYRDEATLDKVRKRFRCACACTCVSWAFVFCRAHEPRGASWTSKHHQWPFCRRES